MRAPQQRLETVRAASGSSQGDVHGPSPSAAPCVGVLTTSRRCCCADEGCVDEGCADEGCSDEGCVDEGWADEGCGGLGRRRRRCSRRWLRRKSGSDGRLGPVACTDAFGWGRDGDEGMRRP